MSEKVRPSFDQFVAKRGEPSSVKAAREKYEAAVKKLASTAPDSDGYAKAREEKRAAAVAHSEVRQAEEAKYYAEEIAENVEAITKMKAETAKGAASK